MTHEYVIATGGSIMGVAADDQAAGATGGAPAPTAIAWAADRILAVGSDEAVRAISRGDSTFIDLAGCAVTPAPADIAAAEAAVRAGEDVARVAGNAAAPVDLCAVLAQAGLLEPGVLLEPGAPAELAFWSHGAAVGAGQAEPSRIVALVRGGAFTNGDEHAGPFGRTSGTARATRPTTGNGR